MNIQSMKQESNKSAGNKKQKKTHIKQLWTHKGHNASCHCQVACSLKICVCKLFLFSCILWSALLTAFCTSDDSANRLDDDGGDNSAKYTKINAMTPEPRKSAGNTQEKQQQRSNNYGHTNAIMRPAIARLHGC